MSALCTAVVARANAVPLHSFQLLILFFQNKKAGMYRPLTNEKPFAKTSLKSCYKKNPARYDTGNPCSSKNNRSR
jgi:hypothetical protein